MALGNSFLELDFVCWLSLAHLWSAWENGTRPWADRLEGSAGRPGCFVPLLHRTGRKADAGGSVLVGFRPRKRSGRDTVWQRRLMELSPRQFCARERPEANLPVEHWLRRKWGSWGAGKLDAGRLGGWEVGRKMKRGRVLSGSVWVRWPLPNKEKGILNTGQNENMFDRGQQLRHLQQRDGTLFDSA